uniref:Putative secreted protein n=1 Tax=Ixodes ricinus TaxID=34613 RepID=A0A6B0UU03_IXORI
MCTVRAVLLSLFSSVRMRYDVTIGILPGCGLCRNIQERTKLRHIDTICTHNLLYPAPKKVRHGYCAVASFFIFFFLQRRQCFVFKLSITATVKVFFFFLLAGHKEATLRRKRIFFRSRSTFANVRLRHDVVHRRLIKLNIIQ